MTGEELLDKVRWSAAYMATASFEANLDLNWLKKSRRYASIPDVCVNHLVGPGGLTFEEGVLVQNFMIEAFKEDGLTQYIAGSNFYWKPWYWRSRLKYLKDFNTRVKTPYYNHLLPRVL